MNDFAVIANIPLDIKGRHYDAEEPMTLTADDCAPLLVQGHVRLSTSPAPQKRKRGRPKKDDASAPSYQRRDMQPEQ